MNKWENRLKILGPLLPAPIGFYGFMQIQGMTVSWALSEEDKQKDMDIVEKAIHKG